MELLEKIDSVQNMIFNYDLASVPAVTSEVLTAVLEHPLFDRSDPGKLKTFNAFTVSCMRAIQDRDYLCLADILEYDIKPFILKEMRG